MKPRDRIALLLTRWREHSIKRAYARSAASLVQNIGPERALAETTGELHEAVELYTLAHYAELLIKEME